MDIITMILCLCSFITVISASDPLPPPYGLHFVGVGYDLIDGNPQGGQENGGVDPGLKPTRVVLEQTFNDGRVSEDGLYLVPDQLLVQTNETCSNETRKRVIAGSLTYQRELLVEIGFGTANETNEDENVTTALQGYEFTASASYERIRKGCFELSLVYFSNSTKCSWTQATYETGNAYEQKWGLGSSFVAAACQLPSVFDQDVYMEFLSNWGTHVTVGVELGWRFYERTSGSQNEFVRYVQREEEASLYHGGGKDGYESSLGVDIDHFSSKLSASMHFGENREEISTGSEESPEPVQVELIGLYEIFQDQFWTRFNEYQQAGLCTRSWKATMGLIRLNMIAATIAYPIYRLLNRAEDPLVEIPVTWPMGIYGLPQSVYGCPLNPDFPWHDGIRFHDTEDTFGENYWSNPLHLQPYYGKNDMEQHFCMRTVAKATNYDWDWPQGEYCVFKMGSTCPSGMEEGWVYWDDEDLGNTNSFSGTVPTGVYNSNTKIYYCCRTDGRASKAIYLPIDEPFFLFQHKRASECQQVVGMQVTHEWFHWDDEDAFNSDDAGGEYPKDNGGRYNHELYYCFYEKVLPTNPTEF